ESFASHGRRIPQRLPCNQECRRTRESVSAGYWHLVHRLFLPAGRNYCWIPQFDLERPIVKCCFAGGLIEVQDVYLIMMHEIEGADTDAIGAPRGQLRRIRRRKAAIARYILLRTAN